MDLSSITPLVLTFNEAPNIGRTLERLSWASYVVVVDSFSTDETLEIIRRFPNGQIVQRKFDNHTDQWNFGLQQVKTEWVLSLDADYLLTKEFIDELKGLNQNNGVAAHYARFTYCINGKPLRGALYPPRAALFNRQHCRYETDGHTQLLKISGPTTNLQSPILHDDRKPLDRWLQEQSRYARIEAEHLLNTAPNELNLADRLRCKIIMAPFLVFFYTLFGKGLIFDGWPGWYYVFQRTMAEVMLSLRLIEKKLEDRS